MRKLIRIFSLWILPLLVLLLVTLAGFIWWCFASQAGSKWLVHTAAVQMNGSADNIRGSLRTGLYVGDFNIDIEPAQVSLQDFHLKVVWSELIHNKRLHINDISLRDLELNLPASSDESESTEEEFTLPALPIELQLDRFALDGFNMQIAGEPIPVDLLSVDVSAGVDADRANLVINELQLAKDSMLVSLQGKALLNELAKPWPFDINLTSQIQDSGPDAIACPARVLQSEVSADDCQINLSVNAKGSLTEVDLVANAIGDGVSLDAKSKLFPERQLPLGPTNIKLELPDNAGLDLLIATDSDAGNASNKHSFDVDLLVRKLGINKWLPDSLGSSELNLEAKLNADLNSDFELLNAGLAVDFLDHNKWNGQPLNGHLQLDNLANSSGPLWPLSLAETGDQAKEESTANLYISNFENFLAQGISADLKLGNSSMALNGDIAAKDSKLTMAVEMPDLSVAWPDLPGGLSLNSTVNGDPSLFNGTLKSRYVISEANATKPMEAPVDLGFNFNGGFGDDGNLHAEFDALQINHATASVHSQNKINLVLGNDSSWHIGRTNIAVQLQDEDLLDINLDEAGGTGGEWFTKGALSNFFVGAKKIEMVRKWLATDDEDRGVISTHEKLSDDKLELGLTWDVKFTDNLSGNIKLQRVAGDITVPTEIPVKLDLVDASLNIDLKPQGNNLSKVLADLRLDTEKMGNLRLRADTVLHVVPEGGFVLKDSDKKNIHLEAESEDLAWVNLFLDGAQEIGGTITADISGSSKPSGGWDLTGPLTGKDLSFVIPDQGVRLLDGTLEAHFEGMSLALDELYFPAKQRVVPKETRTKTWLTEDPDAQDGYLKVSGMADLAEQLGSVKIELHRYPAVQRSDRYVMLSGDLNIDVEMPQIVMVGGLEVDAGWFDIDMLNDIPELSSDVVIIKRGETLPEEEPSLLDIKADISIDMGKRFYVTGFGLDTGVVGKMDVHLANNKIRAIGALRTRGGGIEAYGQKLQLRRGLITFQGDITNPVLDIEALRTDVTVQAGVGISGTARAPKIGLVSYPEVSETEKISWLLLGHGPDAGGAGDMTLLFSVGSSFLSGGEPFYKRFGLDELSMRSGELGSTGSVLPVESVVTTMDSGASPIEQRFIVAGKQLSKKLRLSLEQALAQTGTVARLSYKLMWRLQSELTVGTTNGLALVYRWFSLD